MNYLSLCQQFRQECGISGTGPSTVESQTGEMKRVVDWINQAWIEVQLRRTDWEFQRADDSGLITTQNNQDVALPSDFGAQIALTLVDGSRVCPVGYVPRGEFEALVRFTPYRLQRPSLWTVASNNIRLNTLADQPYPLRLEYFKGPAAMSKNSDLPGALPDRFHWIIIYKAMMLYGAYEDAPEVFTRGKNGYMELLRLLEREQLPPITAFGAMA